MKNNQHPDHAKASIEQSEHNNKIKHSLHIRQAPLPDPQELKEYKNIDESFPQRIIAMTEKEQRFRHIVTLMGQVSFIVLVVAGYGLAAYAGIKGAEFTGSTIAIGVSYVVYVFKSKDPKPPSQDRQNEQGET